MYKLTEKGEKYFDVLRDLPVDFLSQIYFTLRCVASKQNPEELYSKLFIEKFLISTGLIKET